MKRELVEQLNEKYPELLKANREMAVGDGWYDLVNSLLRVLDYWNKNLKKTDDYPVEAVQIKEKFGTLRFYYRGGNEFANGAVQQAELMSGLICEECGAPGKVDSDGGWLRALCEEHKVHRG